MGLRDMRQVLSWKTIKRDTESDLNSEEFNTDMFLNKYGQNNSP